MLDESELFETGVVVGPMSVPDVANDLDIGSPGPLGLQLAPAAASAVAVTLLPAAPVAPIASTSRSKGKNSRSKRQGTGAGSGGNSKRNKRKSEPTETEEQRLARLVEEKRRELARVKEYILRVQNLNNLLVQDDGANVALLGAVFSVVGDVYEEVAREIILEVFKKVATNDIDLVNDIAYASTFKHATVSFLFSPRCSSPERGR